MCLEGRRCGVESLRSALSELPSLCPCRSSSAALRFSRYSLQWHELHSLRVGGGRRGDQGPGKAEGCGGGQAGGRRWRMAQAPRADTRHPPRPPALEARWSCLVPLRRRAGLWGGEQGSVPRWHARPHDFHPAHAAPASPDTLQLGIMQHCRGYSGYRGRPRSQQPHLLPVSWSLRKLELFVVPQRAHPAGSKVLRELGLGRGAFWLWEEGMAV